MPHTAQHITMEALKKVVAEKGFDNLALLVTHGDLSRRIQQMLFSLGYTWHESDIQVCHTEESLLNVRESGKVLTFSSEWCSSEEDLFIVAA